MSASAGRILLMPKGDYSSAVTYMNLDWVRHNGAAWVCTTDNTTNVPPAAGVSQWQLLASDSSVSRLDSLQDVSIQNEVNGQFLALEIDTTTTPPTETWVNMTAEDTYSSLGTTPISGAGVADALSDYYTKSEIELDNILKYGGTKTASELTVSPNPLLISANEGVYYRATQDFVSTSDYVQGAGHLFQSGCQVSIIEVSAGVYKFNNMNFAGEDEWHTYNGSVEEITENSTTGSKTIVFHDVASTDAMKLWADTADGSLVKFTSVAFDGVANTLTYTVNVGVLPTKFRLRKVN